MKKGVVCDLHHLKILLKYYEHVINGSKTFELRKFDRDYKVGDLIQFDVINECGQFICRSLIPFEITYILSDVPHFGLFEGYCILSIKPLDKSQYDVHDFMGVH